jgi:hypothetical protein
VTVTNTRENVLRALFLLSALLFAACGRPATEKECDEIVVRITELELKGRGAAGTTADEVKATREALKKTTMRECVGRRISDKAMACVRSATTAEQIVKECF